MDSTYNKTFYDSFCGEDYSNTEVWTAFFGNVADKIIEIFSPKTVLDAGCATGYLVSALRDRGVEAWGFDISSYAISSAKEEIQPYLNVQSLTDPLPSHFPNRFDLAVTIEVLEHMFPEEGSEAIAKLCSYSDTVIFSSTPSDINNRTHVNVQQSEYWAKEFSKNSFFRNLMQPMDFISPQAMLFHKKDCVPNVIFDYENLLRIDKIKNKLTATVLFDTGNGFNNESTTFEYDSLCPLSSRITLPAGCKRFILNPIGDSFCTLYNLQATTNLGEILPTAHNAVEIFDGILAFNTCTPHLLYSLEDKPIAWVSFSFNIMPMDDIRGVEIIKKHLAIKEHYESIDVLKEQFDKTNREIKEQLDKANREIKEQLDKANRENTVAEQNISHMTLKLEASEVCCSDLKKKNAKLENNIIKISKELENYQAHYNAAIDKRNQLQARVTELEGMYSCISRSACWRMTKPLRVMLDLIKKPLRKIKILRLIRKGLRCYRENGFKYTWNKVRNYKKNRHNLSSVLKPLYTEAEMAAQRKYKFSKDIKISILVPLYNTPEQFLHEMIRSVLNQTYGNWELCLADGSDAKHQNVEHICKKYVHSDKRVKYKKLEKNLGISENTNACIDMSTGDYIALFDHDDLLHPSALYNVMTEICENDADFVYTDEATFESPNIKNIITVHCKPDYAIDNLRANNYICHLSVFARAILEKAGKFRHEYDGSQDHDMILRLTENANKIVHIPKVLYFWRSHPMSVAMDINSKTYAIDAGKRAVRDSILRSGYEATVESSRAFPTIYKINYELKSTPKVSIIIPNKNHKDDLEKCIDSINNSTYPYYEIIIIDNGSTDEDLLEYYDTLVKSDNIKITTLDIPFNYSKINNEAVKIATGEYYILLNNDIEIITPNWIEEMLMYAQRNDVGAVGAMLYYDDDTIQHAGVVLKLGAQRVAGHAFNKVHKQELGYMGRLCYAQNMSAVTAACLMVKASIYNEVNGFDEKLSVAYNDVDFCVKIREKGYLIVWTPYAEAYHYESKSRGYETESPEKIQRFNKEVEYFKNKWKDVLEKGDPYYNPNFSLDTSTFDLAPQNNN